MEDQEPVLSPGGSYALNKERGGGRVGKARSTSNVAVFPVRVGAGPKPKGIVVNELSTQAKVLVSISQTSDERGFATDTQSMPAIPDSMLVEALSRDSVAGAAKIFVGLPENSSPSFSPKKAIVLKNRFELHGVLGVGGTGTVYKALDRLRVQAGYSESYVAIKLVNEELRSHPDAFVCLQREAWKSQSLSHPNIASVYDFDCDEDLFFMVMECLDGMSSRRMLKRKPCGLESDIADAVCKDISRALMYMHAKNTVHSDVKPSNIFVAPDGGSKLFDLGSARTLNIEEQSFSLGSLTPEYASYETLTGESVTYSDDVYSLACVTYELYSGRHPFDKTPADLALKRNLKVKPIDGMSRSRMRALRSALAFKRDDRTASVKAFYDQFFISKPRVRPFVFCSMATSLIVSVVFIVASVV